jgi:phospholipid/cholesterol/gamma-HCH transport system permease protein
LPSNPKINDLPPELILPQKASVKKKLTFLWAGSGRLTLYWLNRRLSQAAFAGRLFILGLSVTGNHLSRRRLLRKLTLLQGFLIIRSTFLLLAFFGLMMGILWSTIWFGILSNIGGASTLISLLVTIHAQEIAPILTTMVYTLCYGGPMTLQVTLMKTSGQFLTLQLLGIPPEHILAWPRIIGTTLTFPLLLLIFIFFSLVGVYMGISQAINMSLFDFLSDLTLSVKVFKIFKLAIKCLLISLSLSFFCLYNAWQISDDHPGRAPWITRRAMAESFFFSTLAGVLVTVLYG